jgi:hypothetical protein
MRRLRRKGMRLLGKSYARPSRASWKSGGPKSTSRATATVAPKQKLDRTEWLACARTAVPPSQECLSHGPISPIDGRPVLARSVVELICCPATPGISGMVIPAIAMPSIFMPPESESKFWTWLEWQSEFIEPKAQLRSQAAARVETEARSATIEPARMRFIFILFSIVRQSAPPWQMQGIGSSA